MITFPCAKINLGLNVVSRRQDGYHNLETVFFPIPIHDALEVVPMDEQYPTQKRCDLKVTGNFIECDEEKNLVVKAYHLLAKDYDLPRLHIHLHKFIPSQAGLGGGSSDAAAMISLLNDYCGLNLSKTLMERYAAQLGADCAFFIRSEAAYATGIGDCLSPIHTPQGILHDCFITIVKPNVAVSTKEAYAAIKPQTPKKCCRDIVLQPLETWKDELFNDFESSVFSVYPQLDDIKQKLYEAGAVYAQMSGSGSAFFGLFREEPKTIDVMFPDMFTFVGKL